MKSEPEGIQLMLGIVGRVPRGRYHHSTLWGNAIGVSPTQTLGPLHVQWRINH